jgi:hypothetical protein
MTVWIDALVVKYGDAIDSMERALKACPDELWSASMWTVRGVTALPAGMGADLPAENRVQLFSAVWNIAYHAIFFLDFNLSRRELPFDCPPPFEIDDHFDPSISAVYRRLPSRMYSRDELLSYLDHCRRKTAEVLASLSESEIAAFARSKPFAQLLLQNLMHVWEHATQIHVFVDERSSGSSS